MCFIGGSSGRQRPSQLHHRQWRTREDPFVEVRNTQILRRLRGAPGLTAVTLLEKAAAPVSGRVRKVGAWDRIRPVVGRKMGPV
jgi:hypothetical protein